MFAAAEWLKTSSTLAYILLARMQTWRAIIFSQVSLCVCLWLALVPFNVDRFWWNLVTRTPLWSSLAATIMAQIGRRGTARCLFKNSQKSHNSNFKILVHHFFVSVSPVYCKKIDSIRTKLTEEMDFEVFPYGDSGNGTAAAARRSAGYSDWTGGVAACRDRSSGAFRIGGAIRP